MNPMQSMSFLHRRFRLSNPHREFARRAVAIILLVYLGASLASALGEFSLLATPEIRPFLAWTSPIVMPQEWQWRGSVLPLDPMFREAFHARRVEWFDLCGWMLP